MSVALITGSSSGIGLATVFALARSGHTVYATMRDPARASDLVETAAREKLPITVAALDVTSDQSVHDAVRHLQRAGPPIDALVNNAGIELTGAIEELPLAEFRAVMETNYIGAIRCIQAVLPGMRERRSGCIINISSVAGRMAVSPLGPYAASKFALEAVSEALAQEVKPYNVRVAVVEPGIIDTPMSRRIERQQHGSAGRYPQQRRVAGMFVASLQSPRSPALVADKVREILESGTWQLRHPVGPDAVPFLQWRGAMTDEQWVDWGALDDEAWYQRVQADFGMDARPERATSTRSG